MNGHTSPPPGLLMVCEECEFGGEKNGRSFCTKSNMFSSLTRCLQKKALEVYLKQQSITEPSSSEKL